MSAELVAYLRFATLSTWPQGLSRVPPVVSGIAAIRFALPLSFGLISLVPAGVGPFRPVRPSIRDKKENSS